MKQHNFYSLIFSSFICFPLSCTNSPKSTEDRRPDDTSIVKTTSSATDQSLADQHKAAISEKIHANLLDAGLDEGQISAILEKMNAAAADYTVSLTDVTLDQFLAILGKVVVSALGDFTFTDKSVLKKAVIGIDKGFLEYVAEKAESADKVVSMGKTVSEALTSKLKDAKVEATDLADIMKEKAKIAVESLKTADVNLDKLLKSTTAAVTLGLFGAGFSNDEVVGVAKSIASGALDAALKVGCSESQLATAASELANGILSTMKDKGVKDSALSAVAATIVEGIQETATAANISSSAIAKAIDNVNNSDVITGKDTTPPTITLASAEITSDKSTLNIVITGSSDLIQYRYAFGKKINCPKASYSDWTPISTPITDTLKSGDGVYTVCIVGKDLAENLSKIYTVTWTKKAVDNSFPDDFNFTINNNATESTSDTLNLSLTPPSPANKIMISENSDFSGASWDSLSTSGNYSKKISQIGSVTLYIKFKDNKDNESPAYQNTIFVHGKAASIAVGQYNLFAVDQYGRLFGWGSNVAKILGRSSSEGFAIEPYLNPNLDEIMSLKVTGNFACSLSNSGGVSCWGSNRFGELGIGSSSPGYSSDIPLEVVGLSSGVTSLGVGYSHACAIVSGGAKCWGTNDGGQLGDGTNIYLTSPVAVSGLTSGVHQISTGKGHSCALLDSGSVKCWGYGNSGQLGNGSTDNENTPQQVSGLTSGIAKVVTGGAGVSCAISTTGGVKCWGANSYGQLGVGDTTEYYDTPQDVSGLSSGVSDVSIGDNHICALLTTGGVKCWGSNSSGQLGNGNKTDYSTPQNVQGLSSGVTSISVAYNRSCALLTNGLIKCWGAITDGLYALAFSSTPSFIYGFGDSDHLPGPPPKPRSLSIAPSDGMNSLTWSYQTRTTSFLVLKRKGSAITWTPTDGNDYSIGQVDDGQTTVVSNSTLSHLEDTGLENWSKYYYAIFSYYPSTKIYSAVLSGNAVPHQSTQEIGWFGRTFFKASISNNKMYLPTNTRGLEIYDISTPSNPQFSSRIDSIEDPEPTISGNYVFSQAGVIDLTNPSSRLSTTYLGIKRIISGTKLYYLDGSPNEVILKAVDISDPSSPTIVGSLNLGEIAMVNILDQMFISGNTLYIYGSQEKDLRIINISSPTNPTISGTYTVSDENDSIGSVCVSGNHAFLSTTLGKLLVIDTTTPASPSLINTVDDFYASNVACQSNYLFASVDNDFNIYNISDVQNISLVGQLNITPSYFSVIGNLAVLLVGEGVSLVDISNKASPALLSTIRGYSSQEDFTKNGNYLYIVDLFSGLVVLDVSTPTSPTISGTYLLPNSKGVAQSGNYVYVVGSFGLKILNVSNLSSITLVGGLDDGWEGESIFISGNYAYINKYVEETGVGLGIINISNPASPSLVGSYDGVKPLGKVGSFIYSIEESSGLKVIDVSTPASPTLAGSIDIENIGLDGAFLTSGNYGYLLYATGGKLSVLDISNPASPTIINTTTVSQCVSSPQHYDLVLKNNKLFTSSDDVIDITTPSSPEILSHLYFIGSKLYIDGTNGYSLDNGSLSIVSPIP